MDKNLIRARIEDSIKTKQKILQDEHVIAQIQDVANIIIDSLSLSGKILLCGNGGSSTDASHIAGEFVGRFQRERKSVPAIALNTDFAAMTAISNDYGYDRTFARAVEAYMQSNDILIGISTSGNSENVYQAILEAKKIGGKTVALLGKDGGKIAKEVDISIIVPSNITARIQESHIMIGHIICELVENSL